METGRKMVLRGLTAATDGNITVRLDERRVLSTPTGCSKGELKEGDLVVADLEGRSTGDRRRPSSELGLHLAVYKARPDVGAVIHAHPPTATGFACAGVSLEEPLVSEVVMGLGSVPLAPYATTGTPALARAVTGLIAEHDAVLLANHGVLVAAADLQQAFWKLETVEQLAKVSLVVRLLGKKSLLPPAEVERLKAAGRAYFEGLKSA